MHIFTKFIKHIFFASLNLIHMTMVINLIRIMHKLNLIEYFFFNNFIIKKYNMSQIYLNLHKLIKVIHKMIF